MKHTGLSLALLISCGVLVGCGTQPEKDVICTSEYQPICGVSNGVEKTYDNLCETQKAGAIFVAEGVCKEAWEKARDELIAQVTISSIKAGDTITSPLLVSGQAPGTWFFEGSAPLRLVDSSGIILAEGYIETQEDRMTEELVPFEGTIQYQLQGFLPSKNAKLIFQAANASGEKERDAEISIPVIFG